jgi:putative tricarboxylic transport membrane protein
LEYLSIFFSLQLWMAMILSVGAGIVIGALPGLTPAVGVGLLVPVTFGMKPVTGLVILGGIYVGAVYGGAITAILLNTPGEPGNIATTFDGYPMARKGEPGRALGLAGIASTIGGIFSVAVLLLMAPPLAKIALRFGPAEYFTVAIFGLTVIVSFSQGALLKGVISAVIGLVLGIVGQDPIMGYPRFAFIPDLVGGVELIPCVIGLFCFSQGLVLVLEKEEKIAEQDIKVLRYRQAFRDIARNKINLFRSSILGTVVGIVPGAGLAMGAVIAYNEARRFSKKKEEFGHGAPEGIIASEAANNAVVGGSLIPLITLGVPGNAVSAIFLGGIIIQGLPIGPELFTKYKLVVYPFLIGLGLAHFIMLAMSLWGVKIFAKTLNAPIRFIAPSICVFSVIGSYTINNNLTDAWIMMFFGVLGYLMKKFGFSTVSLILGLILGPMAETSLQQALIISRGSLSFLGSPICIIMLALSAASVGLSFYFERKGILAKEK